MKTSPKIHRGPAGGGMSSAMNPEMHDEVLVVGSSTFTTITIAYIKLIVADYYVRINQRFTLRM